MSTVSNKQINAQLGFETELHPGSIKSAMKLAEAGSRDLWQVPPAALHVLDNFNARIKDASYYAHIRWLADSMKLEGFYQHEPLAGYVAKVGDEQVIYIYEGHCRREAALLAISEGAEILNVPVVVSQAGLSMEDLTVALVRSNGGKPLSPYEVGVVCKRLVRFGLEVSVIASRLSLTEQHVNNLLSLMASPIDLRKMVIEGVVSATTAIEMLAKHGEKALERLQEAQARANAAGKTRVTGKHVAPDHAFKKAVKKSAVPMFQAITEIKADPGYQGLAPSVREKLEGLLAGLGCEQLV